MQTPKTKFGKAVRSYRQVRGLDQKTLAKLTGLSAPYICQIETTTAIANPSAVVKLARKLGADPIAWLKLARPVDFKVWAAAFGWTASKREAKNG